MDKESINIIALVEFLENIRLKSCYDYKESYKKCIENKNTRFETCHLVNLDKLLICTKRIV